MVSSNENENLQDAPCERLETHSAWSKAFSESEPSWACPEVGQWASVWCCTHTWVGTRVYFLDGEVVCYSTQDARRSDEYFSWASPEAAIKVRDYLRSLTNENEFVNKLKFFNGEEELGEGYQLRFNGQIIHQKGALYQGQPIRILEHIRDIPNYGIDQKLRIQLPSNEEKIVEIEELMFNYHLK